MVGADEILLDLVERERLVAVTALATDPAWSLLSHRARGVPGRIHAVSAEAILAHRPDLVVLAPYVPAEVRVVLGRARVRVVTLVEVRGTADVRENLRRLGAATARSARADALVSALDRALAALERATRDVPRRPEVLAAAGGFVAGPGTQIDDLIRLSGGRNAAVRLGVRGHARVDPEVVLRADPEQVLVEAPDAAAARARAAADPVLGRLAAVRAGRVLYLPRAELSCASHHLPRAARTLLRQLHPDRAAEVEVQP
jgi:iron complex transport system substrate-binding protein